ncbi:hypothetical protein [Streptomyces gibsoniae]|uniref:Uncharacterized protein n=1 Tax=Streptomyces gibsoniae TaxID=3075529 RepID=A0ABU2U465_9ACTN|nr:hypothetical protein [Streptomyces sp. DSM 41699]MDT0467802.1 hypothetical protein [Streptomyces sp. DSM 41699]
MRWQTVFARHGGNRHEQALARVDVLKRCCRTVEADAELVPFATPVEVLIYSGTVGAAIAVAEHLVRQGESEKAVNRPVEALGLAVANVLAHRARHHSLVVRLSDAEPREEFQAWGRDKFEQFDSEGFRPVFRGNKSG